MGPSDFRRAPENHKPPLNASTHHHGTPGFGLGALLYLERFMVLQKPNQDCAYNRSLAGLGALKGGLGFRV